MWHSGGYDAAEPQSGFRLSQRRLFYRAKRSFQCSIWPQPGLVSLQDRAYFRFHKRMERSGEYLAPGLSPDHLELSL